MLTYDDIARLIEAIAPFAAEVLKKETPNV
jgi:hypothetical protein